MAVPGPLRPDRPHPGPGGAGRTSPPARLAAAYQSQASQRSGLACPACATSAAPPPPPWGRPAARGRGGLRAPHVTAGPGDGGTGHRGSRRNPPGPAGPTPA